ncbi:MAG: 50S ribosomal protein L22 [Acidobacteriota bacterium]|nr:50S ribosomal protein L22 [Acidobacteriota bacterium]
MEATASAKYLRGSAQKARLVIDMIRGKDVNKALAILRFSSKRAANGIEKCMRSAIANANEIAEKANVSIDPDDLWVKVAFVDRGPTKNRRRVRPAPQGRAYREQRHFCHVTILLSNDARPEPVSQRTGGNDSKMAEAKPAKLVESKSRKRGGAAAAPRAKRTASKTAPAAKSGTTETAESQKKATKLAAKRKTGAKEEKPN